MQAALLAALLLASPPFWGDEEEDYRNQGETFAPAGGWWFIPGINIGGAFEGGREGMIVGVELSVAHLWKESGFWAGGYVDGIYDVTRTRWWGSAGAEVGFAVFGVDFGPLLEFDGQTISGFRARGVVTVGSFSFYGGGMRRFGRRGDDTAAIVGVLLKVPIKRQGRGWRLFY